MIPLSKQGFLMVQKSMAITLTPEQETWLQTHVARGDFPSIEEAARQLIDERIAEHELEENDDMAWAKPYVDEGLAALERGDVITLDEHKARNAARLAAMKG
jgi:antitoxin ParD1/3/4